MATHDYVIANGTGAAVRSDLNDALAAIVSNNSSSSEPATTYAYQWWADTTANVLKIRNSANNGWITLRELDGTMLMEDGSAASPGLSFASDLDTGIFRPSDNEFAISAAGNERMSLSNSSVIINQDGDDVDFRVESNGNTHMLFVDGGNNRVGIGTSSPATPLHIAGSGQQLVKVQDTGNTHGLDIGNNTTESFIATADNKPIAFYTNNLERAQIDSSGRLGIGLSSNITSLLHVESSFAGTLAEIKNTRGNASTDNGLLVETSTTAAKTLLVKNAGTERFSVQGDGTAYFNGNVGINTTSPNAQLEIGGIPNSGSTNELFTVDRSDGTQLYSINYNQTTNTVEFQGNTKFFAFQNQESNGESMRITSTGDVGIGTSSPESYYANQLVVDTGSSSQSGITIVSDSSNQGMFAFADGTSGADRYRGFLDYNHSNNSLAFGTNGGEVMRLTTSGKLRIGMSDATADPSASNAGLQLKNTSVGAITSAASVTTGSSHAVFLNPNGVVGTINTSGSGTSYNTSSDYRLKENVVELNGAITRVKQLAPKRFNFIVDADTTVDGFLAHEAQNVVPEAVTGTHNGIEVWKQGEELPDGVSVGDNKLDDDGNTIPEYQGIDQSKLVPLLTAALQEAIAKIETLESKVAALEAG